MSKGVLIFILLIPILAAVGHDAYYYYNHQEEGFKLSELGWLWTTYHTPSHDAAYEYVGVEGWKQYFLPILSLASALVAAIFSGIVLFFIIIIKALSSIGKGRFRSKKKIASLGRERGASSKKMKYSRK